MSSENYRKIARDGFDETYGKRMWGTDWDRIRQLAISMLPETVAVDTYPINHILTKEIVPRRDLYPPWTRFCFDVQSKLRPDSIPQSAVKKFNKTYRRLNTLIVEVGETDRGEVTKTSENVYQYRIASIDWLSGGKAVIGGFGIVEVQKDGGKLPDVPLHPNHIWCACVIPPVGGKFMRIAARHMEMTESDARQELEKDIMSDASTVIRFVSFMQTRNIKVKKKFFSDYKPRKRQRHKVYRYYELIVTKPSIQGISQQHGEGVKGKALHSVRGHLAHYTEDKPLFGTPGLHGNFFIPQHIRGSLDYGEIKKTYKGRSLYG